MEEEDVFRATTTEVPHLVAVLSALAQICQGIRVFIGAHGLVFVSRNIHTMAVSATLDLSLFSSYTFRPKENNTETTDLTANSEDDIEQHVQRLRKDAQQSVQVCLDLTNIVECFSINQGKDGVVRCSLSYGGEGHPFVIKFRDALMTEMCEFSTFVDVEDENQLLVDLSGLVMEATLSSDVISDALSNMRDIGVEDVYLFAQNEQTDQRTLDGRRLEKDMLMLVSRGEMGFLSFDFPELDKLTLKAYEPGEVRVLKNDFIVGVYRFDILRKITRAVKISQNVRIRKDRHGLTSFHMVSVCNLNEDSVDPKVFSTKEALNTRNGALYHGTVIEFVLLEMAVDEEDGADRAEIMEFIKAQTRNTKKRRNKRKKTATAMGNHNVVDMFRKQKTVPNFSRSLNDILHVMNEDNESDDIEMEEMSRGFMTAKDNENNNDFLF